MNRPRCSWEQTPFPIALEAQPTFVHSESSCATASGWSLAANSLQAYWLADSWPVAFASLGCFDERLAQDSWAAIAVGMTSAVAQPVAIVSALAVARIAATAFAVSRWIRSCHSSFHSLSDSKLQWVSCVISL